MPIWKLKGKQWIFFTILTSKNKFVLSLKYSDAPKENPEQLIANSSHQLTEVCLSVG